MKEEKKAAVPETKYHATGACVHHCCLSPWGFIILQRSNKGTFLPQVQVQYVIGFTLMSHRSKVDVKKHEIKSFTTKSKQIL